MVHLTHAFVNKILRNKIESEMNKFKIVEEAFKTIKTATVFFMLSREYLMLEHWLLSILIKRLSMESCLAKLLIIKESSMNLRHKEMILPTKPKLWKLKNKFWNQLRSRNLTFTVCIFLFRKYQRIRNSELKGNCFI